MDVVNTSLGDLCVAVSQHCGKPPALLLDACLVERFAKIWRGVVVRNWPGGPFNEDFQSDADPAQPFNESPAWKSRPAGRTPHRMSPHHQAEKNGSTARDGGWKLGQWDVDDLFNDAL